MTLTIRDEENPYRYAETCGQVVETVGGHEARNHIDELSQKYHGSIYQLPNSPHFVAPRPGLRGSLGMGSS